MSNAAIYLHPNAIDTSGKALLGRHSAGESFLRGFLRHGQVDAFHLWVRGQEPQAKLQAMVERIQPPPRPVNWIAQPDRHRLKDVGVVHMPDPSLDAEAFQRQPYGSRAYAISGLTHTTATATVMRIIPDLLTAPVEPFDALICTSTAVREAVEFQLARTREYLTSEFGPRKRGELMRVTIPLGVNVDDFRPDPAHRAAWRTRLGIPDEAVVALYVGRHNVRGKMNPALMARALEGAARKASRPVVWLNSGWMDPPTAEAQHHADVAALCPSVTYLHVDGRDPATRFSIWSAGDLFISFSDNIQETFGLTPVEAMAAGLPCVVTDWNGYKDTVRHGVDGFRIPTVAPRPGFGGDLAYWFANGWINYDNYVGATAQSVSIDFQAAEQALLALIENPDQRRSMGAAAAQRAREVFDWQAVVPQYQALWAEQNARRRAAPPDPLPRINPYRPDPYRLFANYPTRHLQPDDVVVLEPGLDWPTAARTLEGPLAGYSRFNRPTPRELEAVFSRLATGPATVTELRTLVAPARANYLERGLLWLARHALVRVAAAPPPDGRA